MAALEHLSSNNKSAGPGQFDFILLDPPWPNASAKRARSYERSRTLRDTEELLLSMGLEDHIAPEGYVGIWITNKPVIRDLVLGEQDTKNIEHSGDPHSSLFDQWGVDLVEEWIWIKTTIHGEPVTDLESAWRKPYEIMLLGQRRPSSSGPIPPVEGKGQQKEIKRRIIAGVPDLHSRKPCLKEFIEDLMPDSTRYRALEVFARHVSAGWWAWGDEVLKFNWEGNWVKRCNGSNLQQDAETGRL
ncbi:MAG: ATPase synthesis protein 25 mitochondrial [Watsoniomyces obsoletus]|nr:MAG: ATPase synthesis protein 25 mitochondrial [Watsoniomyces obsoletus]